MTAVRVSVDEQGPADAPVLLLANSLGTTRAMWNAQVPALAERFRVLTFDTRGHGASPVPEGPYSIDDLVDDVLALLDERGLERVHMAGLSLGGMTAMRLAAREPARVDRLALLCTAVRLDGAYYAQRAATARTEGTASFAAPVVSRWVTPAFAADHPDVLAGLEAMVAAIPDEGYAGCAEAIAGMDLRGDLGQITAPTLVIAGAGDEATPPALLQEIAEGITGAELVIVDPGAHLVPIESPDQVTDALLAHFDLSGGTR